MVTAQESADYVNAFNGDDDLGFVPAIAWTDNGNRSSNEQHVPSPDNVLASTSSHNGETVTVHGYYNNNNTNNNPIIYSNSAVSDHKDDTRCGIQASLGRAQLYQRTKGQDASRTTRSSRYLILRTRVAC